ncbi:hypothetical protein MJO29_014713 [Puccinia striiformis f. sp. tritici]|nr:hypothetical protein MJO29_014713 [Puccinia striiformis f. sp. tritici]
MLMIHQILPRTQHLLRYADQSEPKKATQRSLSSSPLISILNPCILTPWTNQCPEILLKVDPQIIKGLFDNGFMGIENSPEHGGSGAPFTSAILVIEELAQVDPSALYLSNTTIKNCCCEALLDEYIPDVSTSKVASFCLSEPGGGLDAFALATRAAKASIGRYIINGSKMWFTVSKEAEIFVIFSNLNPSKNHGNRNRLKKRENWVSKLLLRVL